MPDLLPLFLNLSGRSVALVGGGRVAAGKLRQLVAVGAHVRVIAPEISSAISTGGHPHIELVQRAFVPADIDDVWLVVAAATPEVNAVVAAAAESRHVFVNAVDDPANASAFLSGTVRREGVTIAISTSGEAPALTALVREAVEALLPGDLDAWMEIARTTRLDWRRENVPMEERKPRLLRALNARYERDPGTLEREASAERSASANCIPLLNAPEDSWP